MSGFCAYLVCLYADCEIIAGTAQDVSYLIDFLPAYLFPNEERTISQFLCVGKSLGGHATWIVLRNGASKDMNLPQLLLTHCVQSRESR